MEDATVFADNFDWKRAFGATLTSDAAGIDEWIQLRGGESSQ